MLSARNGIAAVLSQRNVDLIQFAADISQEVALNRSRATKTVSVVFVAVVLTCSLVVNPRRAYAQVTSNVLLRVLMIRAGDKIGSSFTIDVDGRQYLVTAKHVVANLKERDTVDVWKSDAWHPIKMDVLRCDGSIDIAVLVPPEQLTDNLPLEPTSAGFRFFQDIYFAGFPYGAYFSEFKNLSVYPIPFVKKGLISATAKDPSGETAMYLDGHNNPGFSGGPIVFRDLDHMEAWVFKVVGVVSGYQPELTPVLKPVKIKPNEDLSKMDAWRIRTVNGQKLRYEDTDQMVSTNTGIVVGYSIDHAVELIRKHPNGPKVSP